MVVAPRLRLALEGAQLALENAGFGRGGGHQRLPRNCGVHLAGGAPGCEEWVEAPPPAASGVSCAAARVSYLLGLGGLCGEYDSAGVSSLVALHAAARSLSPAGAAGALAVVVGVRAPLTPARVQAASTGRSHRSDSRREVRSLPPYTSTQP